MPDITPTISERNEVKLAVMSEKIANIESSVSKIDMSISKLESKIDGYYATKSDLADTKRDVNELRDNQKWIVRLIIGAVVTAVLAVIGLQFK